MCLPVMFDGQGQALPPCLAEKGFERTRRDLNPWEGVWSLSWVAGEGTRTVPSCMLRSGPIHGMVCWRQGRMEEEIMNLLVA